VQDPDQTNVDDLNNIDVKIADISGAKRRNIRKLKLRNLKQTVR